MSDFGQKEDYMQCCNDFLRAQRPNMQDFIDKFVTATANPEIVIESFLPHVSHPLAFLLRLWSARESDLLAAVPANPLVSKVLEVMHVLKLLVSLKTVN